MTSESTAHLHPTPQSVFQRLKASIQAILINFGPTLVFFVSNHFWGERRAIVFSVIYSFGEIVAQRLKGQALTSLFKFSAATTLIFGTVDLYLPQSVFFKFEAVITNALAGGFFVLGAYKEKPLIQEFAERSRKLEMTPKLTRYFFIFTLIWAGYFSIKAGVYAWLATRTQSLENLLLIRAVIGSASFYALLGISIFGGPYFYPVFERFGLLSVREDKLYSTSTT